MKKYLIIILCLLILPDALAVKTVKVIQSFNAGELSPLMDSRKDQSKYLAGCRTLENFIPLIYGGAQRRPGTQYIAGQKSNSAKGRVEAFEHSVDDTYILLFENQVIRLFKDGAQVLTGDGSEDLTALNAIKAHWKLNDDASNTVVLDADGNTHNGVSSTNTEDITTEGKVGTGCFDLDGQYAVSVIDDADFTFVETVDGDFSIAVWVRVTEAGVEQTILSKWDETTGAQAREWKLFLDASRKLKFVVADESLLLDSDLVAHWKMNDSAQSATITDEIGNNDGTLSDGDDNYTSDHSVAGKISNAISFDGSDDIITVTDADEFSFVSGDDTAFSISAWINMTDATDFAIINKRTSSTSEGEWAFFVDDDDKIKFYCTHDNESPRIGRIYNTAITAQEGSWIHVVATYDGSEAASGMDIYLNGSAVDNADDDDGSYTGMTAAGADVRIGRDVTNGYSEGKIDNVMIFGKELSATEVTSLYNSNSGREELGTVYPSAITDDALDIGWRFVVVTYNGGTTAVPGSWTGATAMNDTYTKMYIDGAVVDIAGTNLTTYSKMEDTGAAPRIGAQESSAGVIEKIWANKIDNVAIFGDILDSDKVAALYDATAVYEITTPYLTADLFELKFEQSADVMYITHPDYESRRLSRLADDDWLLQALDLQTGPFRDQNFDTAKTIVADGITGSVTLTAVGHAPFVSGTTAGHLPNGSTATAKSQTGALFRLIQAVAIDSIDDTLTNNYATDPTLHTSITSELAVPRGVTWDFTTNGTWTGTVKLEREYGNSDVWETVLSVVSVDNKNVIEAQTEDIADAQYRVKMTKSGDTSESCEVQFSIRDTSHIGIVEITSVTSPTVAVGTVLTTLASTDKTHRWSEGSFSNFRGWPIDVAISSEERLTFAGNISEPLTIWGSAKDDWTSFREGTLDDDAISFTLIGSGQQNRIRWLVSKDSLFLGTVGGEHILGASKVEEALTPTNARARLQTTYGSEDIAALVVNQAIIFVQRGGKKIREFLYNFDADAHKADDLTIFSQHITGDGIVDMAYQRTPDPTLWCIRTDGQIAIMTYERDQKVFSWSRIVTRDGDEFESVAIIFGGTRSEDEVWVTVKRSVNSGTVRYVERFFQRAMPSSISDMKFLDSYITDTGGDPNMAVAHLKGETVQVLGDGLVQATKTVDGSGRFIAETTADKYQVGLGYTSTLKPMKLDIADIGLATTKRINKAIINVFETIGGEVGPSIDNLEDIPTGTALYTGHKEISMPGGYSREGDIIIRQTDPLPLTALSLTLEVGIGRD